LIYHFSLNLCYKTDSVYQSFFAAKEWFAAGGYKSAPVSIHAKGRYSPSKTVDIEQSFNYIYYSQTLPSENPEYLARIFEVLYAVYY